MFASVFTANTDYVGQPELLLSDEEEAIRLAEEFVMQDGFGWVTRTEDNFRNLCLQFFLFGPRYLA